MRKLTQTGSANSMSLKQNIQSDLNDAVKSKNEIVSLVLRSLISEVVNKTIELGKKDEGLNEQEIQQIVLKEIKKRQDAIEQYKKGGREDLVENEEKEIQVLKKYAPQMIDEVKLGALVDGIINELGAKSVQDMGRVMGAIMQKAGNTADGNLVNKLVREKLTSEDH